MGCLTRAPSPGSGVTDNKVARLPCLSKRAQMEGVNPDKMAEEKKGSGIFECLDDGRGRADLCIHRLLSAISRRGRQ